MNSFPKIIDNRKKVLFDCLKEVKDIKILKFE